MAAKAPPPGFVDLATAQSADQNTVCAVIGVVIDYLPPTQSRTGDYQLTFKLQDHSLRYSGEGLKVRFFKKRLEDLPLVKAIGDVVLLRNVRVHEFNGEPLLVTTIPTAQLVFSAATVPSPAFKLDYVSGNGKLPCQGTDGLRSTLGPVEQDYIITLKSELSIQVKAVDALPAIPVGPRGQLAQPAKSGAGVNPGAHQVYSRKFKLVKDLEHRVFSDICVEVVKKFTNMNGNCELYVTDYTANNQMFYYAAPGEKNDLVRDGDQFGYNGPPKREWPGPYGFMVLKVNLSEPHASFANHRVSEGALIALENVKIKLMPNNDRLEGDMWPDQNNPTKVQIRPLNGMRKEASDLRLRKEEYWAARRAVTDKALEAGKDTLQKMSKKQRKRMREKQERQKAREEGEAAAVRKIQANKHVRCTYKDQPLTTISHILDKSNTRHTTSLPDGTSYTLPFVNARYHIKAHVVDFYPPKLQDFAIQLLETEADDDKSEFSMDMTWNASTPNWEWSFAMQVEEVATNTPTSTPNSIGSRVAARRPPSRMWINVSHLEAQHLFGNAVDDPTDLREDAALLNQLREKLYILWGDLEELKRNEEEAERKAKRVKLDDENEKSQQPSNLPFNCCLQEYGVLRDGGRAEETRDWERQFMMFGVTIN